MRKDGILSVLVASATLAACTLFTGPDDRRVVGIIEWTASNLALAPKSASGASSAPRMRSGWSSDLPVLEAPDTVEAGVPFEIVIRTYGNDGCWEAAGAEIAAAGMTVGITPYDRDTGRSGYYCTMAAVRLPRTLRISFPQPGQGLIRITGRKVLRSTGDESHEESVTVAQQVIVR